MAHLTVRAFGALEVSLASGETAHFQSDQTRALLIYLAVEADRPHRREALAGLLWPDCPEETARHNLRQALFNLRETISDPAASPPSLHITRHEIQFNPASDCTFDVMSFNAHLTATASHPHPHLDACAICAPRLEQAVDLYRGRFLQEFFLEQSAAFEEWAVARREALHQRALDALTHLAAYYEQHGDWATTRRYASRELELDPWREQAHRQVMRVLTLEGQVGAALAQYETCRRLLAQELEVEPSSETRELYEQIRDGSFTQTGREASTDLGRFPVSDLKRPLFNLPTPLTPFIGRERELADLGQLIADPACRCITLVGPGGIGKTRLAAQAATAYRHSFAEGTAFVPLVSLSSVEAIIPAIADGLGFSFYGTTDLCSQLLSYVRDKQILLILDNVEHLLADESSRTDLVDLVMRILCSTSALKLLVTSREPLNAQYEWVFDVGGLELPDENGSEAVESSAAVALFLQRAQRARVGFWLSEHDWASVVRLCQLVDGNPLALELAATWVRTLSLSEIVKEIERNLDILSTTARDLPERHRSLRAVFDHSWKLLTTEEQKRLSEVSIFRGNFAREAAEQVAGASLSTLAMLVGKSLLDRTSAGHYHLHELVRQYAAANLTAESASMVAERHSRYYLDWLGQCTAPLRDRRQKETVTALAAEVDNLRAAWEWAIQHGDLARALAVSPALWYLFELRSWLAEGEGIFGSAAEGIQASGGERTLSDDTQIAVNAMRAHAAFFSHRLGKVTAAYAALLPSATYLRSSADHIAGMYALGYLGFACWQLGKFLEARESLQASLEKAKACSERWYETVIAEYLGYVMHDLGEEGEAQHYLTEALANARELGDPMLIIQALSFWGQMMMASGETSKAERFWRECLALAREIGYRSGIGRALDGLALAIQEASPGETSAMLAASCNVFQETGDLRSLAMVLSHQGHNSLLLEHIADAQNSFMEALRLSHEGGYPLFVLDALEGLAEVWARTSPGERAFELVTLVLQDSTLSRETRSSAERLRAELESRLTLEQIRATQARVQDQSVEQAVVDILRQPPESSKHNGIRAN